MGAVTLCDDFEPESTALSNLFIDEYMKDANDAELKIYLYLLREMKAGKSTSILDMADQFNLTERETVRCLRYWQAQGLVHLSTDEDGTLTGIRLLEPRPRRQQRVIPITPMLGGHGSQESAAQDLKFTPAPKEPQPASPRLASGDEAAKAQLLFIVESYIGKPLSPKEMQTVYYITDDLHFSEDLVDYLFQYCVGMGKKDFRYIEKVAANWAESGISTARDAQKAVAEGKKKASTRKGTAGGRFNSFAQNTYDFDDLEKKLLEN
jgi:DnaD/phage-associated family protein